MPEDVPKSAPCESQPPEPTDVRFGMRGLLLTMATVAMGAAALGPYFRGLAPEARGPVAVVWGACGVIVLLLVGYHARTRIRLERQAGRTILALTSRGIFGLAARPWLIIISGVLWIGIGLYYLAVAANGFRGAAGVREPVIISVMPCLLSATLVSMGITSIWWNRTAQLREHGVLRGLRLLRWTHITSHRWHVGAVTFEGVDQRHKDMQLTAIVAADERKQVFDLLVQKLSARVLSWPEVPELSSSFGPAAVKPALVPIRVGPEVSLRGIWSAFVVYVAFGILLAFRPWGRPSTDFDVGTGIGCAAAVLLIAYEAWRAGAAGAPLVRLQTRLDWPSAGVALLIALGCYYINQQFLFPTVFVAGVMGFGAGVGASVLFGMLLRDKFDLCENGVMLIRWTFLPWNTVRVVQWNPNGNGALVLRSGWRRIAARVPTDQRAAVQAVLKDKSGEDWGI